MVRQYNTDLYRTHGIKMKTISTILSIESKENLEELRDKIKDLNHVTLMRKAHRYARQWKIDRQRYLSVKRLVYDLTGALYRPESDEVTLVLRYQHL